jgi:hypothetical protein
MIRRTFLSAIGWLSAGFSAGQVVPQPSKLLDDDWIEEQVQKLERYGALVRQSIADSDSAQQRRYFNLRTVCFEYTITWNPKSLSLVVRNVLVTHESELFNGPPTRESWYIAMSHIVSAELVHHKRS